MVGKDHRGAGGGSRLGHALLGVDIFVPALAVGAEGAGQGAAGIGHHHRLALVLDREDIGQGAERVAGREDDVHRGVAQGHLGAFRSHRNVARPARGHAARHIGRAFQGGVPVGAAHHHLGAELALQGGDALVMVAMGMAEDDVFDVLGIELQLGQAIQDFRLRRPGEVGVDDDQAGAGLQRPGGMLPRAQPIEIVEHLIRRGIPDAPVGRRPRHQQRRRAAWAAWQRRGKAQIDEGGAVIQPRGCLGRIDMAVDFAGGACAVAGIADVLMAVASKAVKRAYAFMAASPLLFIWYAS